MLFCCAAERRGEKLCGFSPSYNRYQGRTYLIQTENNKGWDYLGLWCTAPGFTCMSRVFFDGSDGVSEETIRELIDRPFSEEHTLREIMQEIQV